MAQYLLSIHACPTDPQPAPMSDDEMGAHMQQIMGLQEDMHTAGAFVFGGRLHDPDTATVVRMADGNVATTDGPFLESKEHLGGFYIIDADDLDAALAWAARVTELMGKPIEVRPFVAEPQG